MCPYILRVHQRMWLFFSISTHIASNDLNLGCFLPVFQLLCYVYKLGIKESLLSSFMYSLLTNTSGWPIDRDIKEES